MNPYIQIAIVIGSGIGSWTIAGWVTVNVMKYQMTQFMAEVKELKEWKEKFEEKYHKNRIDDVREIEKLKRGRPLPKYGQEGEL